MTFSCKRVYNCVFVSLNVSAPLNNEQKSDYIFHFSIDLPDIGLGKTRETAAFGGIFLALQGRAAPVAHLGHLQCPTKKKKNWGAEWS